MLALAFAGAPLPLLAQRRGRAAAAWSCAGVMLGLLALLAPQASPVLAGGHSIQMLNWLPQAGLQLAFRLDGLSLLFCLLILGIGLLVVLYAYFYLPKKDRLGRFYAILLAFMAAMLGVVLSENVLLLVFFWEMTSLSSFLLVAYKHASPEGRGGARLALALTGGGGLALLAGVLLLGHIGGSYALSDLFVAAPTLHTHPLFVPALLLILLGVFTKSAQFPFHVWLPNAMAAPTPVSAYLHSATMVKAGVFLLARLHPIFTGSEAWFWIVGGVGAATLVLAAAEALFRHDIKGLLAYSTISHLGLITLLFGLDTQLSVVAGVFHIINHAVFKASLFMAAGIVDHECGTRDMRKVNGMARYMPLTATLAIVAAGAMAGVPLLNGFLSKEMFFAEAVTHAAFAPVDWSLPLFATLAGGLSVAYSSRFVHDIFFNGAPVDLPREPREPPRWMRMPIEILVVICLLVGIFPEQTVGPLLAVAAGAVLQGPLPEYRLALWHGFNLPLAMSALAMLIGLCIYSQRKVLFAWNDRRRSRSSRETFERGLEAVVVAAGRIVAWLDNGSLRRYAILLLVFVLALGLWAWGSAPLAPARLPAQAVDLPALIAFAIFVLAALGATLMHRRRLLAILLVSVVGLIVTLTFVRFSAPDLALTQLAVEAGTILLLLLVLYYYPEKRSSRTPRRQRGLDLALAIAVGSALAALSAWLLLTPYTTIADFYLAESIPGGGGANAVNVILVDFRGFDTLGEITVLAMVALAAHVLLDGLILRAPGRDSEGRTWARERHPLFLSMLLHPLLPLALSVSVYVFLRGHNAPGGGFVAGLITGIALIMQYMANGLQATQALMPRNARPLLVAGLTCTAGIGLASVAFGRNFLTSAHGHVTLPLIGEIELASAMIFDLGVYLVVVTVVLTILSEIGRLSLRATRDGGDA